MEIITVLIRDWIWFFSRKFLGLIWESITYLCEDVVVDRLSLSFLSCIWDQDNTSARQCSTWCYLVLGSSEVTQCDLSSFCVALSNRTGNCERQLWVRSMVVLSKIWIIEYTRLTPDSQKQISMFSIKFSSFIWGEQSRTENMRSVSHMTLFCISRDMNN